MSLRSGEFVHSCLDSEVPADAVKSHGVDLTVAAVYKRTSSSVLTKEETSIGEKTEIPPHTRKEFGRQSSSGDVVTALRMFGVEPTDTSEFWALDQGVYTVEYEETVEIPEGHVGMVFPTEDLVECAAQLDSSLETKCTDLTLESTLYVDDQVVMGTGFTPATLVLIRQDD